MKLIHMERWTYQIREVNLVLVNHTHTHTHTHIYIKAELIQAYHLLFFDANKLIFF